jgi:hypothetical protein
LAGEGGRSAKKSRNLTSSYRSVRKLAQDGFGHRTGAIESAMNRFIEVNFRLIDDQGGVRFEQEQQQHGGRLERTALALEVEESEIPAGAVPELNVGG